MQQAGHSQTAAHADSPHVGDRAFAPVTGRVDNPQLPQKKRVALFNKRDLRTMLLETATSEATPTSGETASNSGKTTPILGETMSTLGETTPILGDAITILGDLAAILGGIIESLGETFKISGKSVSNSSEVA